MLSRLVAVLSDIHGNLEALRAVLSEIQDEDVKTVLILGDLVDYGADSAEVIRAVQKMKTYLTVICVRGNHDDAVIKRDCSRFRTEHGRQNFDQTLNDLNDDLIKALSDLCSEGRCKFDDSGVCMYHATSSDSLWGKSPRVVPPWKSGWVVDRPDKTKVVLGGHSHIQGWCLTDDGLYVNPGSVGQPRNGDPRSQYVICDDNFTQFYFKRVEYDIKTAARKIIDSGRPSFLSTRILLGI